MVWSPAANETAGDRSLPRHEGPAQTQHCTGRRQRRSRAGQCAGVGGGATPTRESLRANTVMSVCHPPRRRIEGGTASPQGAGITSPLRSNPGILLSRGQVLGSQRVRGGSGAVCAVGGGILCSGGHYPDLSLALNRPAPDGIGGVGAVPRAAEPMWRASNGAPPSRCHPVLDPALNPARASLLTFGSVG